MAHRRAHHPLPRTPRAAQGPGRAARGHGRAPERRSPLGRQRRPRDGDAAGPGGGRRAHRVAGPASPRRRRRRGCGPPTSSAPRRSRGESFGVVLLEAMAARHAGGRQRPARLRQRGAGRAATPCLVPPGDAVGAGRGAAAGAHRPGAGGADLVASGEGRAAEFSMDHLAELYVRLYESVREAPLASPAPSPVEEPSVTATVEHTRPERRRLLALAAGAARGLGPRRHRGARRAARHRGARRGTRAHRGGRRVPRCGASARGIEDRVLRQLGARPAGDESRPGCATWSRACPSPPASPSPDLHVVDDPAANAMVMGRDVSESHLVVTSGLLEVLGRVELEGVVGAGARPAQARATCPRRRWPSRRSARRWPRPSRGAARWR